jgi:hypothetical protein
LAQKSLCSTPPKPLYNQRGDQDRLKDNGTSYNENESAMGFP